jgi:hypothetical protein
LYKNKAKIVDNLDDKLESEIVFAKSSNFDWNNKKVEVSFEDEFQDFLSIENLSKKKGKLGYELSSNNLQQGITIKLKVIDYIKNSVKINEIMIESYDLNKGINQFNSNLKPVNIIRIIFPCRITIRT